MAGEEEGELLLSRAARSKGSNVTWGRGKPGGGAWTLAGGGGARATAASKG